ncbi:transporter substrate-binding domain-containing protein [uncultured Microbacterium sp.]|uniref:transporter substrate-binding domain-containing protein n=1 Tax=uncultured Microbacterium sp. TaxID=191216 RepID=UPI00263A3630|nr:transporter substrate-binding domain-containing protein [uncultured Microbacterium sp.]
MHTKTFTRILGVGAAVALMTGTLAACSSNEPVAESIDFYGHTVEFNQELADRVPADWKNEITVPLQVLRPNMFVDEAGKNVGMQPDLVNAIATKLGVSVDMEVAPFDAQVPGVQSGQYAFTTATGDFPARQEVLTMVDYTIAGLGWLAKADSGFSSIDDICGLTIGVAKGTNQEVRAEEIVEDCDSKGIPGTEIIGFSNTLMTVPLEADRIDVTYDSISSVVYFAANESDKFTMVGDPIHDAPIAFGVVAGEDEKAELLRDTIKELMDEGVYTAIFEQWQLQDLMLDDVAINGGPDILN